MPQKAYKRKLPRSQRRQQPTEVTLPDRPRRGFSLPRSPFDPYDPVAVKDPQAPEVTMGLVSAGQEVDALGKKLRTPIMHVLFIDRRSGQWLRIDWPAD